MLKGKPFVKWAGGKRQVIDELKKYVPVEFDTYYEPFIGGGALLFELSPKKAIINDSNKELMNVYEVLCDDKKFNKMCKVLNCYEANHNEEFYYEIRNNKKVESNINLKIKRILLFPLRLRCLAKFKFIKRLVLRFGNSICCPAVTFVTDNCPKDIFLSDYKCNVDWFAWEKLSKLKGRFIYNKGRLMGHRISEETTTTDIINNGIRTKEDFLIYCKFWPKWFAKMINTLYKNSEKSNQIKEKK